MSVKFKTVKNDFPSMKKGIKSVSGKKIQVGVLDGGEQAWLAGIHEYGCRIKITPEMRAWLHRNGLHVKKSTTEIIIPERSFLRAGFDKEHEKVVNKAEKVIDLVIHGKMSEDQFFTMIGEMLRDAIKDYAVQLNSPPKHPFTLAKNPTKTNPLIQSGDMINAIDYKVE